MKPTQVVLFVLYKRETNTVLSQQHDPSHALFPNLRTFPAGKVKEELHETLEEALLREVNEELGIQLRKYINLLPKGYIQGERSDVHLHPFLIMDWEGTVPEKILDTREQLVWETFDEAADSPVLTRRPIVELALKELKRTNNL